MSNNLNNEETLSITLSFQIKKIDLLSLIESGSPLILHLKTETQLEKKIFFEQNKNKILFLAQLIKNLDLSVRAHNHLLLMTTHCYQIPEQWNTLKKQSGFSKGSARNKTVQELEQLFKENDLDFYNVDFALLEAAKERKQIDRF